MYVCLHTNTTYRLLNVNGMCHFASKAELRNAVRTYHAHSDLCSTNADIIIIIIIIMVIFKCYFSGELIALS